MRFLECFRGLQKLSSLSCNILPVPQGSNNGLTLCCSGLLTIHSMTARCTFEDGYIAIAAGSEETTLVPRRREYVHSGKIPKSRDNER